MKNLILTMVALATVIALTMTVSPAFAGSVDALPFLRMGVSARAMGMGSAYTGVSDDTASSYYNPAGVSLLAKKEVSFMTGILSNDRSFNWLSFGMPLGKQTIGASVLMAGVKDIPKADASGLTGDSFKSSDMAFFGTYSKKFTETVNAGASLKILSSSLDSNSATGFGFDIGFKFSPSEKMSCGVVFQDIMTTRKWNTDNNTKETIPNVARAGLAYKILKDKMLLAADVSKISDRKDLKLSLGTEYSMAPLAFRAGFDDSYIAAGFGVSIMKFTIDYALRFDDLEENANRHYISVDFSF